MRPGSRPGTVKLIDPSVSAQLLTSGDDVSPRLPAASGRPLHSALGLAGAAPPARAAAAPSKEEHGDTDSDEGILSDPEETLAQEERLERRVGALRRKLGLGDDKTLKQVFKLLDCLIGQYKLNRTERLLQEVGPDCTAKGGDWRIKYIQSLAFCRWKQYRFKEARTARPRHTTRASPANPAR